MQVRSRLRQVLASLFGGQQRQFERQLPPGDPRRTDSLVDGAENGAAVVEALQDGGVLVEQGEGVVLSSGFGDSWKTEIAALSDGDDGTLADAVGTSAPGVERAVAVEEDGRSFVVVDRGDDEQLWISRPVAIAEIAAIRALPETVDPEPRLAAARPLRLFLEECPDCGGRVGVVDAEKWPAVNRADEDPDELLICYDCGERLYTF